MTAILELGSAGCGYQQHLAAIRAAFASTLNAGFRRDDAALGIVVVSDEDDCSALDPSLFDRNASTLGALQHFRCIQFGVRCAEADMTTYGPRTDCRPNPDSTIIEDPADFVPVIQALAHDRRRVAVAAVVGDNEVAIEGRAPSGGTAAVPSLVHSCEWIGPNSNAIVADPAVRLTSLAEQFDDRGTVASICDTDLTRAATTIGIGLRRAMGDSCIEDDLDLASCSVVDQLGTIETKLPACNGATTACYDVITDEAACPHAAHHKLAVHHDAAPGTYTLVRC